MGKPIAGPQHGRWIGLALVLVLSSPVALFAGYSRGDWWWSGTDVDVPRDGRTHTVTVNQPGAAYAIWSDQSLVDPTCVLRDENGGEIPLRFVPRTGRSFVNTTGVAKPEASFLFATPRKGVIHVRCDDVEASPTQTLGLGPSPDRLAFSIMNWGALLLGPALFLAGLAVGAIATARFALRRREGRFAIQ